MSDNLTDLQKFLIEPAPSNFKIDQSFTKLILTDEEKAQLSVLGQQFPMAGIAESSNNMYYMSNPKNLKGRVIQFKNQPGQGSAVHGADGKIIGHVSYEQIDFAPMVLSAFTIMSMATGQYFMAIINKEMTLLNSKIDTLLTFLYGEKHAELLSEISYVRYAQRNYHGLIRNEFQRQSVITNIQQARKIAIKDIEFYIADLHNIAYNTGKKQVLKQDIQKGSEINSTLNMALQLYLTSLVMEVYYSQNSDPDYINNVKEESSLYINKCNSRIVEFYGALKTRVINDPDKKLDKTDLETKISENIAILTGETSKNMEKKIGLMLDSISKPTKYVLNANTGETYYKVD